MNFYNEIDSYCCDWLENLIREKLIPDGIVDRRSIVDILPAELTRFTQCHFFAGLGGWPLALRKAAWPDRRAVWTGSCPCTPFSTAGKRLGFADDRHLWPWWRYLIAVERPPVCFGEQVASAADWLRLVRGDLEALEYAVGCMPIEAASAGADHLRDRYWFVADGGGTGRQQNTGGALGHEGANAGREANGHNIASGNGEAGRAEHSDVADLLGERGRSRNDIRKDAANAHSPGQRASAVSDANIEFQSDGRIQRGGEQRRAGCPAQDSVGTLQHPAQHGWGEGWTEHELRSRGITAAVASIGNSQVVECPDGKWRRLPPPRVRWLGVRISARVAKLRAFGNAIDPRPAAAFITASMQALDSLTLL